MFDARKNLGVKSTFDFYKILPKVKRRLDPQSRYHEGLTAGNLSQSGLITLELLRSVVDNNGYDEADFTRQLDEQFLQQMDGSPYDGPGGYTNQSIRGLYQAGSETKSPGDKPAIIPTPPREPSGRW